MRLSELTNIKFAIYNEYVKLIYSPHEDEHDELLIPIHQFMEIADKVQESHMNEDKSYEAYCLECNKFKPLLIGYCKPCRIMKGMAFKEE